MTAYVKSRAAYIVDFRPLSRPRHAGGMETDREYFSTWNPLNGLRQPQLVANYRLEHGERAWPVEFEVDRMPMQSPAGPRRPPPRSRSEARRLRHRTWTRWRTCGSDGATTMAPPREMLINSTLAPRRSRNPTTRSTHSIPRPRTAGDCGDPGQPSSPGPPTRRPVSPRDAQPSRISVGRDPGWRVAFALGLIPPGSSTAR